MRSKISDSNFWRWFALCSLIVMGPLSFVAASNGAEDGPYAEQFEEQLKHAETYYWFGMSEQGNMDAYAKGFAHLANSEQLVDEGNFSPAQKLRYRMRIEALRNDLAEQTEIAHDTLMGLFPLYRFIVPSIFAESTSAGNFEVLDDPRVMATTTAAKKLALEVIKQWTQRPHLDVVFTSTPHSPMLENEALYLFNISPKFFVHNAREVVDALDEKQLEEFQAGRITPEIKDALLKAWGIRELLIVFVREIDIVDDDYFYIVEGRIYDVKESTPTHNFQVMGFSRDRNAQFYPILITHGILLLIAFAAFWSLVRFRLRPDTTTYVMVMGVIPLLAFAIGRCTPWAIAPAIQSISQIPETLAIASFWLPCLAGAAFLLVPMVGFWLVSLRLKQYWQVFNFEGRLAATFVAVAVGAVGYLAVPTFLFLQSAAVGMLIPLTVSAVLLAAVVGRSLDSADDTWTLYAAVPLVLSLLIGAAAFHGSPSYMWLSTGIVVSLAAVPIANDLRQGNWRVVSAAKVPLVTSETAAPTVVSEQLNIEALGQMAENPQFQKFPEYQNLIDRLQPVLDGRTVHSALRGPSGSGLSVTAEHVVSDLAEALKERNRRVAIMRAECSQPIGEPMPFAPFRQLLAQHFEIDLLASREGKGGDIDEALGAIFGSMVPFSNVLFPATEGASITLSSSDELFKSIAWMFRRLTKRETIILFIDDAQWLDDSSRKLLEYLLIEFPVGGENAIAIVVASHESDALNRLKLEESSSPIEISYPTQLQQVQILIEGIGLAEPAAKQIVDRLGPPTPTQGGLFRLLQIVASLARCDAFVVTDQGFGLKGNRWPEDVDVPDEMRGVVREHLQKYPESRSVIECAACASERRQFSATLVARALDRPRLNLLSELDGIDRGTSIVYDVPERDDFFAFQSSFMLDLVRKELRIAEHGPATHDVPQIIREYFARLAVVLEETLKTNSGQLYRVANYYYAAGASHAEKGMRYCQEAANAACAILDFEVAERYLKRAEECAHVMSRPEAIEVDRTYIACQKAHLEGQFEQLAEAAEQGKAYLDKHQDAPIRLMSAVAQAHYDAGKTSGDREWFEKSVLIGKEIIARAQTPREHAIGHHIVATSLPLDRHAQRRQVLEAALERLEQHFDGDDSEAEVLGKLIGALAEELSRGTPEERKEAGRLYERRLQLNEQHSVGDAQGQAMTHGGLGRLAFFSDPKDINTARHHFQKDLDISEAIGDLQGQVQMHSLLGACALYEDDILQATQHYEQSWELSKDTVSKAFAATGMLSCCIRGSLFDRAQQVVGQLIELAAQTPLPGDCIHSIARDLDSCPDEMKSNEVDRLQVIVRDGKAAHERTQIGNA